ncbi:MAG: hypothetical protein ACI9BK_001703 [Acidimicrobiales bacterium]
MILRRIASGEASSSPEWDDELLERV